ncbi:MAG: ABC transporter permease [Candidatus Omnitrophica bacterium]|nr:ABC transporter permease [Candidatus Omnitrophota bacterium]
MWLEFFISRRYLFTKRKQKFISLISIISILGVAVGVMALIVVIAVMSGFDYDLRNKIVGNMAHITIRHQKGGVFDYSLLIQKLRELPYISGVSPQIEGEIFAVKDNRFFPLLLKGIEPQQEKDVSFIDTYLIRGSLNNLDHSGVIIGKELASILGISLDDRLKLYSPSGKEIEFQVRGIFFSGMYEYDLNFVYVRLEKAQEIFGWEKGQATQLGLKLRNLYTASKFKTVLEERLGFEYSIRTWQELNRNFFAALKLEKITMFIILTLIVLVAAFNIISTLVVTVIEKTRDIGILMAIGLDRQSIRRIFTLEGLLIGLSGIAIGGSVGMILCILLKKYQFIKLPADIYYIEYLPVRLVFWPDIVLIVLASLLITLFSTIYPASWAARFKPAEALRYE